jgi:hypothetical protein
LKRKISFAKPYASNLAGYFYDMPLVNLINRYVKIYYHSGLIRNISLAIHLTIHQRTSLHKDEHTPEEKQLVVKEWLGAIFMDKLRKASISAGQKGKPYILFRNIVEESEDAVKEEIATVIDKYVVTQVFTYGGFLPSSFQKQNVYTLDKFARVILKRNRNLFLQCLENLETDT